MAQALQELLEGQAPRATRAKSCSHRASAIGVVWHLSDMHGVKPSEWIQTIWHAIDSYL